MEHGDFYELFRRFWWLIFPVFGMMMGMMALWQKHARASRAIDIIKSYADQGKDPPPELLAVLRDSQFGGPEKTEANWLPVFLFGSLAAGFALGAVMRMGGDHGVMPFLLVALVMGGMCLGSLFNVLHQQRRERNRLP